MNWRLIVGSFIALLRLKSNSFQLPTEEYAKTKDNEGLAAEDIFRKFSP